MGKEQNKISIKGLIGAREALQNPSSAKVNELPYGIMNPSLEPPASLDDDGVMLLIEDLTFNPVYILELPTSISSPTVAKRNASFLQRAKECGVENQIAIHTRMKKEDFKLAVYCGAKRVHLFGNSSESGEANGHAKPIKEILQELYLISELAGESGVESLRASLEQATETNMSKIIEFIEGIKIINNNLFNRFSRNVITDIGLPDTNGVASPEKYIEILTTVGQLIAQSNLRLSIHLHDDKGFALDNVQTIINFATENGISLLVESAHPKYPGERSGTRPTFDDMHNLGMPAVPCSANTMVIGNTWVSQTEDLFDIAKREEASKYHIAGIHTYVMENYSNGHEAYPHPGLYSIMGQGNILYLMKKLGLEYQKKDRLIKQAALIARELAGQFGNQNQGFAIEFVKFVDQNPQTILDIAEKFGTSESWLTTESPDLSWLKQHLDERVVKSELSYIII